MSQYEIFPKTSFNITEQITHWKLFESRGYLDTFSRRIKKTQLSIDLILKLNIVKQ